jgi:hypothetical protein
VLIPLRNYRLGAVTKRRYTVPQGGRGATGTPMLRDLDDQSRDCRERAADCAKRATAAMNERERQDWLSLEERYLNLARSIELRRRVERYTNEVKTNLTKLDQIDRASVRQHHAGR